MRKAGGIVALIAGILCVLAAIAAALFGTFLAPLVDENVNVFGMFFGDIFISALVIVLASIILNTKSAWTGAILMFASILAIVLKIGSGFVAICLLLAIIGGIMTLFERTTSAANPSRTP